MSAKKETITVAKLRKEIEELRSTLSTLVNGTALDDHMTACDRVMGASHPCTCGANAARELLRNT